MTRATLEDIPKIMPLARAFHGAASIGPAFDADASEAFLRQIIGSELGAVFLSDHGFIGGVITNAYCDPNWRIAVELFWWAEKGGLSLLSKFENWAAEMRANEIRMTSLADLPRADKILRLRSYAPTEISYQKVI